MSNFFLSLDVETSGPFPGLYNLVSIGAIPLVQQAGVWTMLKDRTFYVELHPLPDAQELATCLKIHGLTVEHRLKNGLPPKEALRKFESYVDNLGVDYGRLLAAAWPATFDIPFLAWYCQRFIGRNFLIYNAFDIGSYAMGMFRCEPDHVSRRMQHAGFVQSDTPHNHNALSDATEQAEILCWLLNYGEASGNTQMIARPMDMKKYISSGGKKPDA